MKSGYDGSESPHPMCKVMADRDIEHDDGDTMYATSKVLTMYFLVNIHVLKQETMCCQTCQNSRICHAAKYRECYGTIIA